LSDLKAASTSISHGENAKGEEAWYEYTDRKPHVTMLIV